MVVNSVLQCCDLAQRTNIYQNPISWLLLQFQIKSVYWTIQKEETVVEYMYVCVQSAPYQIVCQLHSDTAMYKQFHLIKGVHGLSWVPQYMYMFNFSGAYNSCQQCSAVLWPSIKDEYIPKSNLLTSSVSDKKRPLDYLKGRDCCRVYIKVKTFIGIFNLAWWFTIWAWRS